jgi:methionyl-tRNA formyltransferase
MGRVVIFTNRDLASNVNLNVLLPHIHQHVVQIFVSDKVGKAVDLPKPLQTLKFFEQTLPNTILFPQLDKQNRPVHTLKTQNSPFKTTNTEGGFLTFNELSRRYNIPIESLNDVRSEVGLEKIRALNADLALSVRYGKIFGKAALGLFKRGVINFHSGLLPNYRGVLAGFRALDNGDSEICGTLHYIDDATIDTGGIIGVAKIPATIHQSFLHQILSLYPAATDLISQTIEKILVGEDLPTFPQNTEGGNYYTFPTVEEVENYLKKGGCFVDEAEFEVWVRRYLD